MASLLACRFLSIPHQSTSTIVLQSAAIKNPIRHTYACSSSLPKSANLKATHAQTPSINSLSTVVTDESVPEGHAGLHGFLYGEKGSELHGSQTQQITAKPGEDDGSSIIPFEDYVNTRGNFKFTGVYAIYNNEDQIQYVGFSRNVIMSLKSHRDGVGPSRCCSVRVKIFTDPSLLSRGRLEEEKNKWLDEYGVPPGNSTDQDLWDSGRVLSVKAMSEEERQDYEEKKLKLRKAMGENLYDEVEGEDEESSIRRLNLLRATEGDDWSGVIDRQTKETMEEKCEGTQNNNNNNKQTNTGTVSPFSDNGSGTSGLYSAVTRDLTPENVDLVLNDVRPYLIADGGNVEVASVEDGVISLRLQGACGTCPSSTTTMKMGIERVLKEKFGDALKEIRQVDQQNIHATVVSVNSHLDMLRPAIHNYGGSVEVTSIEGEICHVKYDGPDQIGVGIQAAIKDKFPEITKVVLSNP